MEKIREPNYNKKKKYRKVEREKEKKRLDLNRS